VESPKEKRQAAYKRREQNRRLKAKYQITIEQYEEMLSAQNGLCAICKKASKLVVDHCHQTGAVRGLLCLSCNLMLGHAYDNVHTLATAISYLTQ
jgi:hypothetical protein